MDSETSLTDLKVLVESFVQERDWPKFHTPKSLSMALAVESAELMDLFKWQTDAESEEALGDPKTLGEVRDEIADVLILALAFANRSEIDLSTAVKEKVAKNNKKYPVEQFKGVFR